MKAFLLLFCCALLMGGCKLSKEESTLARLHDEMANKKKKVPKDYLTEKDLGVKFYPDADEFHSTQYDEGGAHYLEVGLSTGDSADKVRDFYEKEIGAKSMPMTPPVNSIQRDANGRHYNILYGRFDTETTITIKVSWPTE
ncbi:MAG TPA: hypothetical protein VG820_05960 [Fimbriimonadaceae bacterium]|nr:hypothetical protein [Fimbriimonadaceae bacterium]